MIIGLANLSLQLLQLRICVVILLVSLENLLVFLEAWVGIIFAFFHSNSDMEIIGGMKILD